MAQPVIPIYSAIGLNPQTGEGLSAAAFGAALVQAEASGEKRVAVRINSGGGNWQEGQSMYDLLKASALKVDTYCVGLVASAATLPFMAGNKRLIAAHGKLMIHECAGRVDGGITDLENGINQQKAINDSMAQLYAAATGLTVEKCAELMRATTYLSAEQAVEMGFATGIIPDTQAAQAPPADMPTASLHSYYATLLSAADMKNLLLPIMAAAGLSTITAASSDADVATAVQAAFTERDKAKADIAAANATIAAGQTALEAANKRIADLEKADTDAKAEQAAAAVTALVDGAISTGRITAAQKEAYTTLATANLDSTKAVLDALPARGSLATITAQAQDGKQAGTITAGSAMLEIQARLAGGK